jgi:hypothetical protein
MPLSTGEVLERHQFSFDDLTKPKRMTLRKRSPRQNHSIACSYHPSHHPSPKD